MCGVGGSFVPRASTQAHAACRQRECHATHPPIRACAATRAPIRACAATSAPRTGLALHAPAPPVVQCSHHATHITAGGKKALPRSASPTRLKRPYSRGAKRGACTCSPATEDGGGAAAAAAACAPAPPALRSHAIALTASGSRAAPSAREAPPRRAPCRGTSAPRRTLSSKPLLCFGLFAGRRTAAYSLLSLPPPSLSPSLWPASPPTSASAPTLTCGPTAPV